MPPTWVAKSFLFWGAQNWAIGIWMGHFSWKIGICRGLLPNSVMAHPYQNQTWVPPDSSLLSLNSHPGMLSPNNKSKFPNFFQILKKFQFSMIIYIQYGMKNTFKKSTNKPSIGSVDLEMTPVMLRSFCELSSVVYYNGDRYGSISSFLVSHTLTLSSLSPSLTHISLFFFSF